MALVMETESIFSAELTTSVQLGSGLDAVAVDVVAGDVVQQRSDFDGGLVETWELLAKRSDVGTLYIDEDLVVNDVVWTIEELTSATADMVSIKLMRRLA